MRDDERPDDIQIQTPCPKSWAELVGDERKRFCSECRLHVHNSAALTRAEARELALNASERVCMRIVRDTEGAPVYLDSPRPSRTPSRAASWILAAGAGLLAACQDDAPPSDPASHVDPHCATPSDGAAQGPQRLEILGEVAVPTPEELGDVAMPPSVPEPVEESTDAREFLGRVATPRVHPPTEDR